MAAVIVPRPLLFLLLISFLANPCTLVPTDFQWRGKMKFKFRFLFSFFFRIFFAKNGIRPLFSFLNFLRLEENGIRIYNILSFFRFSLSQKNGFEYGQCKTQTADCRLQTGGKMQT